MNAIRTLPNSSRNQANQNNNISRIEAFIISRIGRLKEVGWSTEIIAEALGVNEEFIERASYMYYTQTY